MSVTWEQLVEHTGGEMVGGELYASIDGRKTLLGTKRGAQFDMTSEGETIARELDDILIKSAIAQADEGTGRKRKGGAGKRVAAEPTPTDEAGEAQDDLDLDLDAIERLLDE